MSAPERDRRDPASAPVFGTDPFEEAVLQGPEAEGGRSRHFRIGEWLAGGWLVVLVGSALLAPVLPLDDPHRSIASIARRGPLADAGSAPGHLLGGDGIGRDMLSRLVWGSRTTLLVATSAVLLGLAVGGTLGILAGYFRGRTDQIVSVIFDVLLSIPAVILAVALVTVLRSQPSSGSASGPGLDPELAIIIALGIVAVPLLGRITRASTLSWAERDFVLASRALGATQRRIIWREIFPNVLPAMQSITLLAIAVAIVTEGTLSILGASVEPDTPTWGNIIAAGRTQLAQAPHIVLEPALMIFFTVLALNFLGDAALRRADDRERAL